VQVGVIALAGVVGVALTMLWAPIAMIWIPVACCLALVIMRRRALPGSCTTVGDLARSSWLVNREPARHSEIFDRVATIIAEQMNIPKNSLRRETRFSDILWV
jgi:hypothetical protein